MSLRVGLLSIALSYILLGTSYSQHEKSNYIHFSNEEGLSNPNISTIEQDREGFIWIGTHNGINVFDGYDFRVYTQTPADSTSLVHNFIYSIYKDKKEDLWIGTGGGGIMKYNYLEDNFIRYTNSPLDSNTLLNDYVTCIRGNDQFLWVATWGGLSSFQFKSGSFKNYKFEKELKNSGIINSIALDKDWLWIGTSEDGIIKFNPSTGEKIRYKENDLLGKNYASNKTKDIYVDKGGKVWVSTHEGGIQFFNNNKKSFENARGIEEKLGAIMVNTINEDKNGNLVLGTSKGMYSYNPINYDVNPVHEQVNQDISEIFFDNQGGTWYGVKDGGINYVSSKNQPFENYSFKADPGNLKGNSIVTSVFILGKDSLLVGYESGLCLYYKVNQGFKKNSIPIPLPVNKTSNEITCIFECRQGYLWLGYNGLLRYDFKTGKSKLYQHDDNSVNSISSNIIRDIIEDKRGHLWIATENGLCEFDKKKEKFIVYSKENFPGMVDPVIFSLTIDQLDALWFGTRNMVIKYKYKNGLATIYDKETYGIHGDNFFFIKGFEQGKMWFSSE
ncbi:MAG: ligand-binding sensor domain-containing protein, partial [Bacteroidota bacterium]